MQRGFSLVEMAVVVAVICAGGVVAGVAISDQVSESKAKAEAKKLAEELRTQHRISKEKRQVISIQGREDGILIKAHEGETCTGDGQAVETNTYELVRLDTHGATLCFGKRGTPIEPTSGGVVVGPRAAQALSEGPESESAAPRLEIRTRDSVEVDLAIDVTVGDTGFGFGAVRLRGYHAQGTEETR